LNTYQINQPNSTISPEIVIANRKFENISANWFELISTMQAETFKNVYLGYTISFKYLINTEETDDFETAYIPGFYKKNSPTNFGFGMQYFIAYRIKF
jgi:hypothetical protein